MVNLANNLSTGERQALITVNVYKGEYTLRVISPDRKHLFLYRPFANEDQAHDFAQKRLGLAPHKNVWSLKNMSFYSMQAQVEREYGKLKVCHRVVGWAAAAPDDLPMNEEYTVIGKTEQMANREAAKLELRMRVRKIRDEGETDRKHEGAEMWTKDRKPFDLSFAEVVWVGDRWRFRLYDHTGAQTRDDEMLNREQGFRYALRYGYNVLVAYLNPKEA